MYRDIPKILVMAATGTAAFCWILSLFGLF